MAIFLTTAYNPGKQSTWEELSSLKVIGRADTWGGVAELWGHIRPPRAETGGKRQEAWTGKRIKYQNSCGPRWHSGITSISVKKESQPTGNLSCEGHQEQRHILLKGNSPINQKVQKPEGGVCITLLFLIPEPSSCSYPVP